MHATGALKDKFDKRDYKIANYLTITETPPKFDLSNKMMLVRNQESEGTCVAFASTAVKEWEEQEQYLSPRFLYDRIGLPDGGAYPREAMKTLVDTGVCPETCQPYMPNIKTQPCINALELAKPNKIKGYARLTTIDEMKRCLVENGPFIISFVVNDSWWNPPGGLVTWKEPITGAHALACVGYDDEKKLLKFKNSWGKSWGENGYGYISYDDAIKSLYDAWSFIDISEHEEYNPVRNNLLKLVNLLVNILKEIKSWKLWK